MYRDLWNDRDKFDNRDYPDNSLYFDQTNYKGIGKFSDEASYLPIIKLVGVRSKCTPYIEKIMKK